MASRKKKRPTPGKLGWASLLLFLLVTTLVVLWILRPVKEEKQRFLRKTVAIPPLREKPQPPPRRTPKPLAAIIIDDMGQRPALEKCFFDLGLPLNFSFLPFAPYTRPLAKKAHEKGFEVLVHIPLDAGNGERVKGLITLKMDEKEVKRRVREAVFAVPYVIGANHHEGSRFTTDPVHTRWLLEEIKALGLFYVDSRTTPKTVVPQIARTLGVPFAERRVFLDHRLQEKAIRGEIRRLVRRAKKVGPTVAIGHPHPETLKALKAEKEILLSQLELVPISVFIQRTRGKK